jgi:hypothetical protein
VEEFSPLGPSEEGPAEEDSDPNEDGRNMESGNKLGPSLSGGCKESEAKAEELG